MGICLSVCQAVHLSVKMGMHRGTAAPQGPATSSLAQAVHHQFSFMYSVTLWGGVEEMERGALRFIAMTDACQHVALQGAVYYNHVLLTLSFLHSNIFLFLPMCLSGFVGGINKLHMKLAGISENSEPILNTGTGENITSRDTGRKQNGRVLGGGSLGLLVRYRGMDLGGWMGMLKEHCITVPHRHRDQLTL